MKHALITLGICTIVTFSTSCVFGNTSVSETSVQSISGTIWAGQDSDGDYYVYRFCPDGSLQYTSPTGSWGNSSWSQDGSAIYMQRNNKYAEYKGTIQENRMEGEAWNRTGKRWTWSAEKQPSMPKFETRRNCA